MALCRRVEKNALVFKIGTKDAFPSTALEKHFVFLGCNIISHTNTHIPQRVPILKVVEIWSKRKRSSLPGNPIIFA